MIVVVYIIIVYEQMHVGALSIFSKLFQTVLSGGKIKISKDFIGWIFHRLIIGSFKKKMKLGN